jgi:enoyl-CoA hydratase/carnithine racemase
VSVNDEIRLAVDGTIATIWLDRPDKRNALALRHWERLRDVMATVEGDPQIRVLAIRSTDTRFFSAGADIDEFAEQRSDAALATTYTTAFDAGVNALASLSVPTVAVVRGLCFGGGLELVQACDVALADESARFGLNPASLGIVYPYAATRRLIATWGARQARYMLSTGHTVPAERAHALGVVAQLVPSDDIDESLAVLMTRIAALSPLAVAAMKSITTAILSQTPDARERAEQLIAASVESPDYAEGLAAFRAKRPPSF